MAVGAGLLRRLATAALALLLALGLAAAEVQDSGPGRDLALADGLRTSDYPRFAALMDQVEARSAELDAGQRALYGYLRAWQQAYLGHFPEAIEQLEALRDGVEDPDLRLRVEASVVNVLTISRRYQESFEALAGLLEKLPSVRDPGTRAQGLLTAIQIHNQVGQYEIGLRLADQLLAEAPPPRTLCMARQLRLDALQRGGQLTASGIAIQEALDSCIEAGEAIFSNLARASEARLLLDAGQARVALLVLKAHLPEVEATRYARLLAEFEALLAEAQHALEDYDEARRHALRVTSLPIDQSYAEPLVNAWRILYQIARLRGETASALEYHEHYAQADKARMDDISARQFAYQLVSQRAAADRLEIENLNRRNEVLQLQQALAAKAVETTRLYLGLILLAGLFVLFWAYKTKRSQMYFMRLARHDALTGVSSRHYFLDRAQVALARSARQGGRFALAIIDIDHFKAVNDRHGHAAGDAALRRVATTCQEALGRQGMLGRIGGEEFAVFWPDCDIQAALPRAEALREAIAAIRWEHEGQTIPLSASIGLSDMAASGSQLHQVMAHADAALYRAKHRGRNRVERWRHDGDQAAEAATRATTAVARS